MPSSRKIILLALIANTALGQSLTAVDSLIQDCVDAFYDNPIRAESLAIEALILATTTNNVDDQITSTQLLTSIEYAKGSLNDAISYAQTAIDLIDQKDLHNSSDYILALNNLATLNYDIGNLIYSYSLYNEMLNHSGLEDLDIDLKEQLIENQIRCAIAIGDLNSGKKALIKSFTDLDKKERPLNFYRALLSKANLAYLEQRYLECINILISIDETLLSKIGASRLSEYFRLYSKCELGLNNELINEEKIMLSIIVLAEKNDNYELGMSKEHYSKILNEIGKIDSSRLLAHESINHFKQEYSKAHDRISLNFLHLARIAGSLIEKQRLLDSSWQYLLLYTTGTPDTILLRKSLAYEVQLERGNLYAAIYDSTQHIEDLEKAIDFYDHSIRLRNEVRHDIRSLDSKLESAERAKDVYQVAIPFALEAYDQHIDSKYLLRAIYWADLSKGGILSEQLGRESILRQYENDSLYEKFVDLQSDIHYLRMQTA